MQDSRPSQSARGINQKLLNLESSQDTVNGVRATLSKSRERINVLECSQETTSRNVETLKTDLHDAVKKSNKNAYLGLSHTSHHRKKNSSHCLSLFSIKTPKNNCLVPRLLSLDDPMVRCGSSPLARLYLVKIVRDIFLWYSTAFCSRDIANAAHLLVLVLRSF